MQSLKPTKSTVYFNTLKHQHQLFNKQQRQNAYPEMEWKQWLYNKNLDLSGKTLIKI